MTRFGGNLGITRKITDIKGVEPEIFILIIVVFIKFESKITNELWAWFKKAAFL